MGQQAPPPASFTSTRPVLLLPERATKARRDAPAPDDDAPSSSSSERQSFLARLREAVFDSTIKRCRRSPTTGARGRSGAEMSRTVMDVDPVARPTQGDTRLEWIKLDHKDEFLQMTAVTDLPAPRGGLATTIAYSACSIRIAKIVRPAPPS